MTEPKLTVTPAGYAIDAQQLLDEVQRLEGLVASLTAERDSARDLAARAGVFTSPADDESTFTHILNNDLCEQCGGARHSAGYCDWCDNLRPTPPVDRPSAYDERGTPGPMRVVMCGSGKTHVGHMWTHGGPVRCPGVPTGLGVDNRPSAYDMPVGSVVETEQETYCKRVYDAPGIRRPVLLRPESVGWERKHRRNASASNPHPGMIGSGWVEGLFSDGLVTEWRLP